MDFSIEDIHLMFELRYPDCTDCEDPTEEHPTTAVAVVLLSASHLRTADPVRLRKFTRYSEDFISAIYFNMQNSKLWSDSGYKNRWFQDGIGDEREFWDHVEIACGDMWTHEANQEVAVPTCFLYWAERDRERSHKT
jgi:hypothetical protein